MSGDPLNIALANMTEGEAKAGSWLMRASMLSNQNPLLLGLGGLLMTKALPHLKTTQSTLYH